MRTRVKFCGMTNVDDAIEAARLGVDAIGLIFVPKSRRCISIATAQAIASAMPPFVARVALFMDADAASVREVLAAVPVELVQFHGAEPPAFCRQFGKPYLKAVPMLDDGALTRAEVDYGDAAALLLDAHATGGQGGMGATFDWARIPAARAKTIVLAGGLAPGNVAAAVGAVRPFAVDVASGVESAPGLKDAVRMKRFIDEVRRADSQ